MELKQIQDLIKFVSKSGVSEVKLEQDDFKITIRTGKESDSKEGQMPTHVYAMPQGMMPQQPMPQQPAAPAPQPQAETPGKKESDAKKAEADDDSKYEAIKAPMIGTFYRSPGPDKDAFVKVGDEIKKGDTVCIVEAMKLFNEIESEVSGKIVKVLVEDATPVEYDQPLFLVDPS